jgi:hypothetical protein
MGTILDESNGETIANSKGTRIPLSASPALSSFSRVELSTLSPIGFESSSISTDIFSTMFRILSAFSAIFRKLTTAGGLWLWLK